MASTQEELKEKRTEDHKEGLQDHHQSFFFIDNDIKRERKNVDRKRKRDA